MSFANCRKYFPFFTQSGHDSRLIYFDNAATSQKPRQVIDAISHFYAYENAPIYRSLYALAEKATSHFEQARATIARFINAETQEIIFTKGATEGINFIASTWAEQNLNSGEEIVLSELEHHANLIPWQQLALRKNLTLKFIPVDADGSLDYSVLDNLLSKKTKLVSVTHSSNAIGTFVDIPLIARKARTVGARIMVDACQTVAHQPVNARQLDCDFLVFSGHKMMGPTGIGILYIKNAVQNEVPPYQFGGGMTFQVSYEKASWLSSPHRYEAGTLPIAQAIGLAQAVNFLSQELDFAALEHYESSLCAQFIDGLEKLKGFKIVGPKKQLSARGHLVSFVHESHHPHDIAAYLDKFGICVRSGHYCAQPLARKLGIEGGSVRASFYAYNTSEEIEECLTVLKKIA